LAPIPRRYNVRMAFYLRQIKLRRWFPPNDRFAACVARMTVLREDFAIEMKGIYRDSIPVLDGNTSQYRMVYFWRNMLRTLSEIRGVVIMLNGVDEFREALQKESSERRNQFLDMYKRFEATHDLLKGLRDDIGGHVQHTKIEKALNGMDPGQFGYLEVGEILDKTHYRFAGELLLETQLTGRTDEERVKRIEHQFRETATLLPVFAMMELIFSIYVVSCRLDE
jgi:hypothetical protein